ncbi:hypothetical protein DRO54_04305 [Candidatus Bathyarchaeota archaeon]|nr:MAG: hypothetical protein DRO54_04305 [Candidatus Bathyarchaeota archaeon]
MPIKAVIFDLDGTLIEFRIDYRIVRAEVKQFLVNLGFPPSLFSIDESVFDMLKKVEVFMRNNGKNKDEIEDVKEKVLSIVEKFELEAVRQTSLIPGAQEALEELKRMGLKLGLFTLNSSNATMHVLKRFRLEGLFEAVVTRESVSRVKPDTSHLQTVLMLLNVEPHEAVIVGDSILDMKSASNLGAYAVGVTTGISTTKQLMEAGATCIITSLTDLPPLIKEINEATGA